MSPTRRSSSEEGALGLFIAGAVFGALAALLLAPEAGADSRKRMGSWLEEHHLGGHDLIVKIKKLLHVRSNGVQIANGHNGDQRRHGRRV